MKQYPQYANHFAAGWRLGRIRRDVRTKAGIAGKAGELVLVREEQGAASPGYVFFRSRSNAIATSTKRANIEVACERTNA